VCKDHWQLAEACVIDDRREPVEWNDSLPNPLLMTTSQTDTELMWTM
jgi:hypothetical protein